MNLFFKEISYKNFLSVGNKAITIQLNKEKNTLIFGKNGSAKTAMFDAIYFALFGRSLRKVNKSGLVNNINKKNCVVQLTLSVGSDNYKIIRGINPNVFELYKNNALIDQQSQVKDYQLFFENNILGISQHTFKQIILLGSTDFVPFMKLNNTNRRLVIEELLDIQMFSAMNKVVKQKITKVKSDIFSLEKDIERCGSNIKHIRDLITELKEKEKLKTEKIKESINQKEEEIKELNEEKEEYIKLNDEKLSYLKELNTESHQKNITESEHLMKQIIKNSEKIKDEIEFYKENDVCHTCSSDLTKIFREDKIDKLKEKALKMKDGYVELKELSKKLTTELNTTLEETKKVNEIQKHISELDVNITNIQTSIKAIQSHVDDDYNVMIENNLSKQEKIKEEENEYDKLKKVKETSLAECNFIQNMLKDDGIKTNIIKMFLSLINKKVNKFLDILGFNIQFEFDECFNDTIIVNNRNKISYGNFSEGEKLRVDLAILFAFREVSTIKSGAFCSLMLIDEVLDGVLDLQGLDSFFSILHTLPENTNTFVISHRDVRDKFDCSIEMIKEEKFSKLIYHNG